MESLYFVPWQDELAFGRFWAAALVFALGSLVIRFTAVFFR
jgi:hypothetical protein